MDEVSNFKDISGEIERNRTKTQIPNTQSKNTIDENVINNPAFNPTSLTTSQSAVIKNEYKDILHFVQVFRAKKRLVRKN